MKIPWHWPWGNIPWMVVWGASAVYCLVIGVVEQQFIRWNHLIETFWSICRLEITSSLLLPSSVVRSSKSSYLLLADLNNKLVWSDPLSLSFITHPTHDTHQNSLSVIAGERIISFRCVSLSINKTLLSFNPWNWMSTGPGRSQIYQIITHFNLQ